MAAALVSGCAALGLQGSAPTATTPAKEVVLSSQQFSNLERGGYSRGAKHAPVTIVEFADYECPFCAQEQPALEKLLHEYDGRVRLVFRDFPVGHPHSMLLAEAARCGGEQGAFWPLHDYIFAHAGNLDTEHMGKYAAQLGLDGRALEACIKSDRYRNAILADAKAAENAGAQGTPTFFLNGKMINGAAPYQALKSMVDRALPPAAPANEAHR